MPRVASLQSAIVGCAARLWGAGSEGATSLELVPYGKGFSALVAELAWNGTKRSAMGTTDVEAYGRLLHALSVELRARVTEDEKALEAALSAVKRG